MTQTLREHHRRIRDGLAEIKKHCERPAPDRNELAAARLRLSRSSSARSKYVQDVLIVRMRRRADDTMLAELAALQRSFSLKRLASSEHITRWTSSTIAGDWNGYCAAARTIWAMMEEQMQRERRTFYGVESRCPD